MRKILFVLILVGLFNCCVTQIPRKPTVDCDCCEEKILQIADAAIKISRKNLTIYKRTITEEETYFLVRYSFIDDGIPRMGGGGYIKISKETCQIIERRFEQ